MPRKIDTNATHLLAHDHRLVEKLFAQYEKADDRMKKADLAQQICNELKIHAMIEEEVFYPALRGKWRMISWMKHTSNTTAPRY